MGDILLESLILPLQGISLLQVLPELRLLLPPIPLLWSQLVALSAMPNVSTGHVGQVAARHAELLAGQGYVMQGPRRGGSRNNACWVMLCCGGEGHTREWRLASCCCRCSREWRSLSASAFAAATALLSCSARRLSCEREDAASAPAYGQCEALCGLPPLITGTPAVLRYTAKVADPCTGLAQGRAEEGFIGTAAHLFGLVLRLLQALTLRALHIAQQLLVGAPYKVVA